jgi:hypothetical protein
MSRPGRFTHGRRTDNHYTGSWIGTENLAAIGVVNLELQTHSESLYQLRYSAGLKKKPNGLLLN